MSCRRILATLSLLVTVSSGLGGRASGDTICVTITVITPVITKTTGPLCSGEEPFPTNAPQDFVLGQAPLAVIVTYQGP